MSPEFDILVPQNLSQSQAVLSDSAKITGSAEEL
jgi:hypothetical protein